MPVGVCVRELVACFFAPAREPTRCTFLPTYTGCEYQGVRICGVSIMRAGEPMKKNYTLTLSQTSQTYAHTQRATHVHSTHARVSKAHSKHALSAHVLIRRV